MHESDLIKGLLEKDENSFRELIDTYQDKVFRTCIGFVHHQEDAEDLTQEVFIEIFRSIEKFRKESKISTWLYRIAVNKSLNHLKKRKQQSLIQSIQHFFDARKNEFSNNVKEISAQEKDVLAEKETAKALNKALAGLAENQRIVFTLAKYDDLSYQQISEIMNISVSSVESLMYRAKQNLQKKLIHFYEKNS